MEAPRADYRDLPTLEPARLSALRTIVTRLANARVDWALTGSTSFVLQGVPVEPQDIDVQTDGEGAYEIERLLVEYVTRNVAFSATDRIHSHFGALSIFGLEVEIMGDLQTRLPDGSWESPVDVTQHRKYVKVDEMRVPVLSLEHEARAYELLGRAERAKLLRAYARSNLP
jgi:hypothetical protein